MELIVHNSVDLMANTGHLLLFFFVENFAISHNPIYQMYLFMFFFLRLNVPSSNMSFFFRFTFDSEFQTLAQRCQTINNFLFLCLQNLSTFLLCVFFFCVVCVYGVCMYGQKYLLDLI